MTQSNALSPLFLPFSMRFPEYFVAGNEARELQEEIEKIIGHSIVSRFQSKRVRSQFLLKGKIKSRLLRYCWSNSAKSLYSSPRWILPLPERRLQVKNEGNHEENASDLEENG